ncbi:MAG: hypothetical protein ACSLE5_04575 [Porticoccaceae bacterium]
MRTMPLLLLAAALSLSGCDRVKSWFADQPDIRYAPAGENYAEKPDFAQIEYDYPIAATELAKITPDYLATLTQEQIDQLYARLPAGPIPDGPFDGSIILPKGGSGKLRVAEILGGLKGLAAQFKGKKLEIVGETLWKGKVFYRDQKLLRNRIEDLTILRPILDKGELAKIDVAGKDAWLLFPAKLYCGQSLLDSRRESIIIDYAFTDEIAGYREIPDFLAGRNGLRVRDEIRMVRPGLYLGRAYLDRAFGLNFVLENQAIAAAENEEFLAGNSTVTSVNECWQGAQPRVVTRP